MGGSVVWHLRLGFALGEGLRSPDGQADRQRCHCDRARGERNTPDLRPTIVLNLKEFARCDDP